MILFMVADEHTIEEPEEDMTGRFKGRYNQLRKHDEYQWTLKSDQLYFYLPMCIAYLFVLVLFYGAKLV
jgi:hypothetical protein